MKQILLWLAHPRMMFWLMPPIMLLLVLGTLAQREIGLYEAERLYFSGWVIWLVGIVPLPGIYPLLGLLCLSLTAKLVLKSPWRAETSGIILTHMGVLLLLLGGLLTAFTAKEGHLSAAEGESSRFVTDYHKRELLVLKEGAPVWRMDFESLREGKTIKAGSGLPFTITPEMLCRNCVPDWREGEDSGEQGIAQQLKLKPLPLEKQDEANLSGMVLRVKGSQSDGRYLLFEPMQKRPEINVNGENYMLVLQKEIRSLPFTVTLDDFEKELHPSTDMAREYQSLVTIDEGGGVRWQALIRMNEPLRVQGYTLYQASFVQRGDEVISVLAVVENAGRVFPYVASLVIGLGLLVHLMMRRRKRQA